MTPHEGPYFDGCGLSYATAADRLMGRPDSSPRNKEIMQMRSEGCPTAFLLAYVRSYDSMHDAFTHMHRHRIAFSDAKLTGECPA